MLHGQTIAATGTISPDGAVGDVGGVPQKGVSVLHEGASVFLVPVGEVGPAKSLAGSSLHAVAVGTLNQALAQLMRQGGTIKLANGTVETHLPATSAS